MDDYLFFFFTVRGESGGSSDSPERRGMRGICSTTASAVTVRAPSGLRDGTVVSVSRRHRRAGLLIHHAGVLDAGRVLRPNSSTFSPATLLRAKGRRHGEGRVAIARQACDHERTPQSLYFVLVLHSRSRTMRAQNVRRGLIPSFAAPRAGLWPSPARRRRKYTQDLISPAARRTASRRAAPRSAAAAPRPPA